MPTINRKINKPARVPTQMKAIYQDIYQDIRWKKLRRWKRQRNPLCEDCLALDPLVVTKMDEVHHIIPWQTGVTPEQQQDLAYDPDNIISLCIPHHKKRHQNEH